MDQDEVNKMTVNERLVHFNLTDLFDQSIKDGNRKLAVEILGKAKLPNEQALETVNEILKNPTKYGYSSNLRLVRSMVSVIVVIYLVFQFFSDRL